MKFLKGLALSLLGLLLFFSLSIFSLVFTLNNTILNPDFVISEIDKLDVTSLITELFSIQAPPEMPYLTEVINETLAEQEPWIKEQLRNAMNSGYDYFLGKSQDLNIVISLEPIKEKLRDNIWETFSESIPAELATLPPSMIEEYFDQSYQQFDESIPSTFMLTKESLSPEVQVQLEQIREYIGYYQLSYQLLIGLILLFILSIILIHHEVKGSTRQLGTIFALYGAFGYVGIFFANYFKFIPNLLAQFPVPTQLQVWFTEFVDGLLAPLEMFNLVCLISGLVLLIVSFVYPRLRPSQPSPETTSVETVEAEE